MDYKKIGAFILSERKAKNLTQTELAEKIFVSEKTISKWENGKGVPDTETLPKLCDALDITINELLLGERLSSDCYVKSAEENLLALQKVRVEKDKQLLKSEIIFGMITIVFFLAIYCLSVYMMEKFKLFLVPSITLAVSFVGLIIACAWMLRIEQKAGYYVCAHCGKKHVPTFWQVFFAMHVNRTRYMKCPDCKKWSWQKKVVK